MKRLLLLTAICLSVSASGCSSMRNFWDWGRDRGCGRNVQVGGCDSCGSMSGPVYGAPIYEGVVGDEVVEDIPPPRRRTND